MCHFASQQYDQATAEFQVLVDEQNLDAKISRDRLVLLHAQCLLFTNQKDEALKRLLAAAEAFKPGVYRTGVLAAISDLYFSKGDWSNTIAWAKQLREAKPSPAQAAGRGQFNAEARRRAPPIGWVHDEDPIMALGLR